VIGADDIGSIEIRSEAFTFVCSLISVHVRYEEDLGDDHALCLCVLILNF
jgi:hypothetical protein